MQHKFYLLLFQSLVFHKYHGLVDAIYGLAITAEPNEFPNVVCILRRSIPPDDLREDVQCTGTLITRDHILSSEHCFHSVGTYAIYVMVGSADLRCTTPYLIWWWITHDIWANIVGVPDNGDINDIAIIKLIEKVSSNITPAVLTREVSTNLYGLDVVVAGWGKLSNETNPHILHKAIVRIIGNDDCEMVCYRSFGEFYSLDERYLCSTSDPVSHVYSVCTNFAYTCQAPGDSGGPVFFGNSLVAINQGTIPNNVPIGEKTKVNIHSFITFYMRFVGENMNI